MANLSSIVNLQGSLYGNEIWCASLTTILTVGAGANVLLLFRVLREPTLRRSPTYILLVSLALSDLCLLCVALPRYVLQLVGFDAHNVLTCQVMFAFIQSTASVSVFNLVCFSIWRYLILTRPLWARLQITAVRTMILCSVFWVFAIATMPTAFFILDMNSYILSNNQTVQACGLKSISSIYSLIFFGGVAPFGLISGFHIAKCLTLRHKSREISHVYHARRSVSNSAVVAIILTYTLAWIPHLVYLATLNILKIPISQIVFFTVGPIVEALLYMNSAVNPFLYFFLSDRRLCHKWPDIFLRKKYQPKPPHSLPSTELK